CCSVDPYPFCEGGKDVYHEGNGRFQLGKGRMVGFGKRPYTGGTMVQGPGFATLHGIGALGLDALPVTIGTSYGGQCHTTTWKVMSQISDALKNSCFEINGLRKCP